MKKYAKDNWIPVSISLPDTNRIVIIQIAELPDPTIGSFWGNKGTWKFEECEYEELKNFTVLAWRDMPDRYVEEEEDSLIFRNAAEARTLSFNAQKRIQKGDKNAEYYEVREKILHATTAGEWDLYLDHASPNIIEGLKKAGYEITKRKNGYVVSWE